MCKQVQKEKNGRKNGSKKMKLVEEEGKPSKELPVETLNIVKRKRKSSNVQNAESRTASVRISYAFFFMFLIILPWLFGTRP